MDRYRLIGSTASPYALKMRSLLRYRRIAFDWVIMTPELRSATSHLRPMLIPVLQYPDGSYRNETSAITRDLERRHAGRSVLPERPGMAFLSDLIEDFSDEWVVKPLFLYRWWDPEDQHYVSRWGSEEWSVFEPGMTRDEIVEQFRKRQISRMPILGATAENYGLLSESYKRVLAACEPHVGIGRFMFGTRPSIADIALYGQLSELGSDPTPLRIMRDLAPFTDHWVRRADDMSGTEGSWRAPEEGVSQWAIDLLRIIGELYLPFLAANEKAFREEKDRLEISAWGLPYALAPFKYQLKCLTTLRSSFASLDDAERDSIRPVLESTGCLPYLVEVSRP
jgi:glutathione S-transferase